MKDTLLEKLIKKKERWEKKLERGLRKILIKLNGNFFAVLKSEGLCIK